MIFTVLGAVAELERNLIKERVHMGISRARKQGKRLGRPKRVFDRESPNDVAEYVCSGGCEAIWGQPRSGRACMRCRCKPRKLAMQMSVELVVSLSRLVKTLPTKP